MKQPLYSDYLSSSCQCPILFLHLPIVYESNFHYDALNHESVPSDRTNSKLTANVSSFSHFRYVPLTLVFVKLTGVNLWQGSTLHFVDHHQWLHQRLSTIQTDRCIKKWVPIIYHSYTVRLLYSFHANAFSTFNVLCFSARHLVLHQSH